MKTYNDILETIGGTPLVRLQKVVPGKAAKVFGKLEFLNPGGSVKDRMALYIINDAEERGLLKPGGTIVENTSGNTGVGVALIGALKGYKVIFTMPDKMSQEKVNLLRAFGAKVVVTPTNVPPDSPDSYYETAKRIASETPDSFYLNQYHNKKNIDAHYSTTGPEIWEDTDGTVDYVVGGIGTGGTMSGIGRYLKEKNPDIKIIAVDPVGSVFHKYFHTDTMGEAKAYKVEGIGEDMLVDALDFSVFDDIRQVNDKECFSMTRRLVREEGLFAGGSSGGAVHVAAQLATEVPPDKCIVVILPDSGNRYLSKIFNDEWMRVNSFLDDELDDAIVADYLRDKDMDFIAVTGDTRIRTVVELLKKYGISQVPVLEDGKPVGILSERVILDNLVTSPDTLNRSARELASKKFAVIDGQTVLSGVSERFLSENVVLVRKGTEPEPDTIIGILTKIDIIDHYSKIMKGRE